MKPRTVLAIMACALLVRPLVAHGGAQPFYNNPDDGYPCPGEPGWEPGKWDAQGGVFLIGFPPSDYYQDASGKGAAYVTWNGLADAPLECHPDLPPTSGYHTAGELGEWSFIIPRAAPQAPLPPGTRGAVIASWGWRPPQWVKLDAGPDSKLHGSGWTSLDLERLLPVVELFEWTDPDALFVNGQMIGWHRHFKVPDAPQMEGERLFYQLVLQYPDGELRLSGTWGVIFTDIVQAATAGAVYCTAPLYENGPRCGALLEARGDGPQNALRPGPRTKMRGGPLNPEPERRRRP